MRTICVEPITDHKGLRMVWQPTVTEEDVKVSFRQIVCALEASTVPMGVIVVLPPDVRFPISATVTNALPVYRNPKLASWLVVGGNQMARTISDMLARTTRRKNVYWFDTEADALAALYEQEHKILR